MLPLPKGEIKKIVIGCVIAIAVIILGVFAYFYFTTDLLKSDSTLFAKYIRKAVVNVEELLLDEKGAEYNNLLQNNKYTSNTEITGNYISGMGTTEENSQENILNNLKLVINGKTDVLNNMDYKDIILNKDENDVLQFQYLHSNDKYGIRLVGLFDKYLAVENKDLKEVAKKMDINKTVPNKIGNYNNIQNILMVTADELNNMNDNYVELFSTKFPKQKFSSTKKEQIELNNGNQVIANSYTLNLTKEELNNIYISVLEKMKQDETFINKVKELEEIFNPTEITEQEVNEIISGEQPNQAQQPQEQQNAEQQNAEQQNPEQQGGENQQNPEQEQVEGENQQPAEGEEQNQEETSEEQKPSAEEIYVDKLDKIITDIKNKNIGNDEATITVYETNGEAVKTIIETKEYKVNIESSFGENGEIYLDVNKEVYGIEDNIENVEVEKKEDYMSLNWLRKKEGTTKKASITQERLISNGKQEKNTNIVYDIGSNKIELKIKDHKEVLNEFDGVEEFTDNNNVTLNGLSDEEYTEVKEILNDKGIEKMNEVTSQVDFDGIFNILYELKILSKQVNISSLVTLTKSEVSRFNSQFEIYQGEGIAAENLEGLIKVVQENLDTVEVQPNDSIKMNIAKGTKNEQLATKVRELINNEQNRRKKYTVSFEYDEESQIIKAVIITQIKE